MNKDISLQCVQYRHTLNVESCSNVVVGGCGGVVAVVVAVDDDDDDDAT